MADELVRVRIGDVETQMGRALAEMSEGVTVLDEPVRRGDGQLRAETRKGGRPKKDRTSVAKKVAEKKAASSADSTAEEADS